MRDLDTSIRRRDTYGWGGGGGGRARDGRKDGYGWKEGWIWMDGVGIVGDLGREKQSDAMPCLLSNVSGGANAGRITRF